MVDIRLVFPVFMRGRLKEMVEELFMFCSSDRLAP